MARLTEARGLRVTKAGRIGERGIYSVHTHVGIFGDWSVQVNERVSMNTFHFMHEYRDSSL